VVVVAGSALVLSCWQVAQELLTGLARTSSTGALAKQLQESVLQLQVLHQLLVASGLGSGVTQSR
jgi:hypothetical protein